MTNRENLSNMSNSELSLWLSQVISDCDWCDRHLKVFCENEKTNDTFYVCRCTIKNWLESEAKNDKTRNI